MPDIKATTCGGITFSDGSVLPLTPESFPADVEAVIAYKTSGEAWVGSDGLIDPPPAPEGSAEVHFHFDADGNIDGVQMGFFTNGVTWEGFA